jgi:ABC-type nitrate/sulfonate/bicarbonate transport system substrate-binding protein
MLGAINQRSDKFILAQSRKGRQEKSLSSSHGLGMYTHFIRIAVVLLLCTVTLGPAVAYSQTKVLVGLTTLNSRVTPLWIAQEQGFFAKNGLEVLLLLTRVSQPAIAGLIAGELQMVFGGSSAALGAFASGADLKVIAGQTNRLTYDLVARPGLRKPEDLRGKRLGAGAIGGSLWMGAVLALEHLGLDASRDQISIMLVGDQTNNIQALEAGSIDAALLDGVFSHRLKQKGFSGQGIVTSRSFLQKHPVIVERFLKGLLEGIDFSLALGNKPVVLKTMTARLKIPDAASAEVGYQDLLRGVEPKPYPSLEALRNVQRLMKAQNPKVGNVKLEELIDDRILRKILGG